MVEVVEGARLRLVGERGSMGYLTERIRLCVGSIEGCRLAVVVVGFGFFFFCWRVVF